MPIEPWLERAAALRPDRTAIEAGGERLTYAGLLERAGAGAAALSARGVRRGDRVAIALPPGLPFAQAMHACLLFGAAAMPVDPRLADRERAAVRATATATVDAELVADRDDAIVAAAGGEVVAAAGGDALGPAGGEVAAEDVALVVHTSGTTGVPRPVELSYGNVLANAFGSAVALGLDPAERWLCPLPLSHVGGLMVLLRSAVYATTAVLAPPPGDDGITLMSLVPTQLARLLDAGEKPPRALRAVLLGGAAADRALLRRARRAGWPVAPTYGLTEACSQVTVGEVGDTETSGRALPGVRMALAPDGEILVEGPTVAAAKVLRTGDLGRLDARGRLIVTGRKTDTIVTGGENVSPTEVEAVLREHPAVADAGVFARPHAEWGEAVSAKVVLRAGASASAEELRAWAAARLTRFKVPKTVELADALPRTPSGKLLRRALGSGSENASLEGHQHRRAGFPIE